MIDKPFLMGESKSKVNPVNSISKERVVQPKEVKNELKNDKRKEEDRVEISEESRKKALEKKLEHKEEKKTKILVWINTYNRPNTLRRLLSDIVKSKENFVIKILIFDDASICERDYKWMINCFRDKLDIAYHKLFRNFGKKNYWKLCNLAMEKIKNLEEYDYYVKLDDDLRLCDRFFYRCIKLWNKIGDEKKICLNFRLDDRCEGPVWTGVKPKIVNYGGTYFYKSQWVDMDFFVKKDFFDALYYRISDIHPSRWRKNKNNSSGVGRDISLRLNLRGYSLYLTTESLVFHCHEQSVMNSEERKINPLSTRNFITPKSRYGL